MLRKRFFIFFILTILIFIFSCRTAFNYKILEIKEKNDKEFFSNLYPHKEEDYEFWLFTGYFYDKKNNLFSYSFRLNKIIMENQIFYILNFSIYDYEKKKNYFYEDSSIHPLYSFIISNEKLSLGDHFIKWASIGKKYIEINFVKEEIKLKLNFSLKDEGNFFLKSEEENKVENKEENKTDNKNNLEIKNRSFFSIPLRSNGIIEIKRKDGKKIKKEVFNVTGYSMFYRNFYFTFMDRFEMFFFRIDNSFYYIINLPKKDGIKSFVYRDKKDNANINYNYNKVINDKNRRYGIIWDFNISNDVFSIYPFLEKNINEGFLFDWYESLIFVLNRSGTLKGLGVSYIQEFTRDKY